MNRTNRQNIILITLLAVAALFLASGCDSLTYVGSIFDVRNSWRYTVTCWNGTLHVARFFKTSDFQGQNEYASLPVDSPINGRRCDSLSAEGTERGFTTSEAVELGIIVPATKSQSGVRSAAAPLFSAYGLLAPLPFWPILSAADSQAAQTQGCNPNGAVFFVDHFDGTVLHVNTCPLQVVRTISVGANPLQLTLTPDATRLLVTRYDSAVVVIDTSTGQILKTIPTPNLYPSGIAATPDGTQAWFTSYFDGTGARIALLDLATGNILRSIATSNYPRSIILTPDGSQAWVNFYNSSLVSVFDTLSGEPVLQLNAGGVADRGMAFNPSGTRAYIAVQPGTLVIYDTATLTQVKRLPVVDGPVNVIVSDPGGPVLVNGSRQAGVTFIDAQTETVIGTTATQTPSVGTAVFR